MKIQISIPVFALILSCIVLQLSAQVAVNTDGSTPDNSAMLDVKSTSKGMLVPRMTAAQRDAISNPANGLLIYCTDNSQYYAYKNSGSSGSSGGWILIGSQWLPVGPGGSDIYFPGGKVGVGNYSPFYSLDVAGDINYTGMLRSNGVPVSLGLSDVTATSPLSSTPGSPGNTRNISISQASASANGFLSSADWNMFNNKVSSQWESSGANINHTIGNVGIGTWSAGSRLTVLGNIETEAGGYKFADGTMQTTAALTNIEPGTFGQTMYSNGTWWLGNSLLFNNGINIGIGTTAPGHLLTVAGTIQTTSGGIMYPDGTTQATAALIPAGSTGQTLRHDGLNWIGNNVLFNDGTNVGIGTTSPGQKLTVAGTIHTTSGGVKFPDGTLQTTAATGIATGSSGQTLRHNGTNWVSSSILFNDGANIGIGSTNPAHARLELNGSVGAAVAMFGADKYGITIEADNPEIGFNYFFNGTTKTIKAGYGAVLGMDPGNGEMYIGNFNGNQSAGNFGNIAGYQRVATFSQSGNVGIGTTNAISKLTVAGVINSTSGGVKFPDGSTQTTAAAFNNVHAIGDTYGGGMVFYVTGDGQHGLIVAPDDQGSKMWFNNSSYRTTYAIRDGIYAGQYNTEHIIYRQDGIGPGDWAVSACETYQGGGYGDWYLPSKHELQLWYQNQGPTTPPGNTNTYWSSTEVNDMYAWAQNFATGAQFAPNKMTNYYVRPIRAF